MKWSHITPERREEIVASAALRLTLDDRVVDPQAAGDRVTVADVADYARGRPLRRADLSISDAVRGDTALRDALDVLLDRYASVAIPLAAAAASSGPSGRRRHAEMGVDIEWQHSSAEPKTVFVRVHAPAAIRPLREIVMRGEDGDVRTIALVDDGDEIETLIDAHSLEFGLLVNENSKLWLR